MHQPSAAVYLETQIKTASKPKLKLMLIDGAIRWANHGLQLWSEENDEGAVESLTRCRAIIAELIAGVDTSNSELAQQVAEIYIIVFRTLTEAINYHDDLRLLQAIEVLQIERETWRTMCEQTPAEVDTTTPPKSPTLAKNVVQSPTFDRQGTTGGFNWEA